MAQPQLLLDGLHIFDGAMGTELYERGHFINRPFEELNLNAPSEVKAVHQAYIEAGAQVITTNTFSAAAPQLKPYDLDQKQKAIIQNAIQIANEARKDAAHPVYIGLSVGPLGALLEPLGPLGKDTATQEFKAIAEIAVKAGNFDLYILETFSHLPELECAIQGIRSVDTNRPILASITSKSSEPEFIRLFAKQFGNRSDVAALGLNCSEGPSDLFTSLSVLRPLTLKPIIVQPNAGIPRQINGRYFYMTSPDYLAKFAKRYVEAGAQGVGGCCGTRPIHIESIGRSLKMAQAKAAQAEIHIESNDDSPIKVEPLPIDSMKKSRVAQLIAQGKMVISIEINPPQGTDLSGFFEKIAELDRAGVSLVNIPDGARASVRLNSLHLATLIERKRQSGELKLSAIPHFTTRDRNLIALQSDLLGISAHGVHDLLLVTGDPPKLGTHREATAVYDIDSIGLTYLVNCLNHAQTPADETLKQGTAFGIGVASNPTAIRLDEEYQRFLYKVESGAHYAITQPIYDADSYLRWMDRLGKNAIPHVVGIWPPVSLRNMEFMANEVPGVFVPEWVLERMAESDSKEDAVQAGIEIATQVMEKLKSACAGFCISAPLGRADIALGLVKVSQQ